MPQLSYSIYQQNLFVIHPIASIEVGDDPSSSQTSPVEERFLWGLYCMVKNNRPDLFFKAMTMSIVEFSLADTSHIHTTL
jgi:hypothetical protein